MTDEEARRLYDIWIECLPWDALFLRHGDVSDAFDRHKTCQDIATKMLEIDHDTISTMSAEVAGRVWAVRLWADVKPRF